MGNRKKLLEAINAAVMESIMTGIPIHDVVPLALRVSSDHPQSGMTLDTICDLITGVVAAAQIGERDGKGAADLMPRDKRSA